MDELTQAIVELLNKERLYAEILLQMDRIITRSIPTLGVCIKENVQLYVNPDYFLALTPKQRIAALKHECGHILHDHIPRFKEMAPEVYSNKSDDIADHMMGGMKHKAMNISADCALNCNIPDCHEDWMHAKNFNLPDGETFEWYLDQLKDNEKMKDMTGFDGHELWGESEGSQEIIREKLRKLADDAAKKAKAAGHLTNEEELLISRLNRKSKNWRAILRQFAAKHLTATIDTSKKKRNRRYGVTVPGIVKTENLHIGVAIDTSGSVSDAALCQFMAEIANIAKYAVVTVVEADAEVKNAYLFDPKKQYKVKGRGGTAYQPAFDYFTNETEVDGVIYFGDMDCFDNKALIKPKYPVLWAIVGNQEPPAKWGSKIRVEVT